MNMNKNNSRINDQTIKFVSKTYEELSILYCQRQDLRYLNYDNNDEVIDENGNSGAGGHGSSSSSEVTGLSELDRGTSSSDFDTDFDNNIISYSIIKTTRAILSYCSIFFMVKG